MEDVDVLLKDLSIISTKNAYNAVFQITSILLLWHVKLVLREVGTQLHRVNVCWYFALEILCITIKEVFACVHKHNLILSSLPYVLNVLLVKLLMKKVSNVENVKAHKYITS